MNGRALFAMPNVPSLPASRLDQNPSKHSERSSAKRRESISICCIPPSPSASPDTAIRVRACLRSFLSMKPRIFQGEKCITHLLHRSRRQAQATRKQQHLFVFRTFAAAFHQNEQSRYMDAKEPARQPRQTPEQADLISEGECKMNSCFIWFYSGLPIQAMLASV